MIVIPPVAITPAMLVGTNAVDAAAWAAGTTYAAAAEVAYNYRTYVSLQAGNVGKNPATEPTWWYDSAPVNSMAAFDTSVSTATTATGGLWFTLALGQRTTALGLMGLQGQSVTVTVNDGALGPEIYTSTTNLARSDGTFYGFCFEDFAQTSDLNLTGLPSTTNAHVTVEVDGDGTTACGLCVLGKQFEIGQAEMGLGMPLEDRGRHYLDTLGNPVNVERGHSKGMTCTLHTELSSYNRVMALLAQTVGQPCMWIAAPGRGDLLSAAAFGRFVRATPVIQNSQYMTTSLEIAGNR